MSIGMTINVPKGTGIRSMFYRMAFNEWLQQELNRRGMTLADLAKRAEMYGYRISQPQLSRILNGDREAGPDACIAIAYGLGLSREEVFRARGWLLREPEQIITTDDDPRLVRVVNRLRAMPPSVFDYAITGVTAIINTFIETMAAPLDDYVTRQKLQVLRNTDIEGYLRYLKELLGPDSNELVEGMIEPPKDAGSDS